VENQRMDRPPSEGQFEGATAAAPAPAEGDAPEFTLRAPPPQPSTARFDFGGGGGVQFGPPSSFDATPPRVRSVPETHAALPAEAMLDANQSLEVLADLRPLGQIHDSFIVAAGRDGLWIIDQHVAHERILFEKVLAQMAAGKVERQHLLMPLVVELTPAQQADYERIQQDFQTAGFDLEPFGGRTLAVKAAPAAVGPGDVEKVIFEILEIAESELRQASLEDVRRSMAASIACRAAIKINTPLDLQKMEWMLASLAATQYPMSCPHGRPIALRYGTKEILRAFHRI